MSQDVFYFLIGKRKRRGFYLCARFGMDLFRFPILTVDPGDLFFFVGDRERDLFCIRFPGFQVRISSARIVSSAWCFRLFIIPTQAIWSRAFSSSVTPFCFTSRLIRLSRRLRAVVSIS